jgi:hypothetical protein
VSWDDLAKEDPYVIIGAGSASTWRNSAPTGRCGSRSRQ